MVTIPDPAVVVLIGPSGSGKSTWAAERYRAAEVVSSDALRGIVGSGEHDLDASADAFAVLDQIVNARIKRGLTTVIDTLGLEPDRRRRYLEAARAANLPAVAVLFETQPAECRRRNRERDRPVPAIVLHGQLKRMREIDADIAIEGWDAVFRETEQAQITPSPSAAPSTTPATADRRLGFVLQISRFEWQDDPAGWLREVATAAEQAGFEGLALMDHLIQIPQVGRAWDPIPEPWVTLGLLAGLTGRLRLGTLVTPVTYRSPGVLAKTVATLDALSGGRAFCGIGAGWWDREHAAYGLPFPSVPERLDQLEVAIETLRALWQPGTKAYSGQRVSLPETTCYPRPVGDIPIIVGGGGERRTLKIAATMADACNLPSDLDTLDRKIAVLREHCHIAQRDPSEVAVTVLDVPIIGCDRDEVHGLVERLRGRTAANTFAKRHHAGVRTDHIDRYRQLADRGVSTVFVSLPNLAGAGQVSGFAPIIDAVS
jgi:F420-dependent oxidoreductase-like protein